MIELRDDLSGEKFGHLTVIELFCKTNRGQSVWKCQCGCGNFKNIRGYHLKGKKIRSCGCLRRETVNIKWQGFGDIPRWIWNRFRVGATRRGIEFSLTAEDMWKQAQAQNMKCALTSEPLTFVSNQKFQMDSNASLDRIDSNCGYVVGNIQWVTKTINRAKGTLSQEEFITICRQVASYEASRLQPIVS